MLNLTSISRQHARLTVQDGRCTLADAGSRFGTVVKGAQLSGEVELTTGDTFQCGQISFMVEQEIEAGTLLSEAHALLEDSGTLLRRIEPEPAPVDTRPATPVGSVQRRRGVDRRVSKTPYAGPERRTGRDRRQARFLRLLGEIGKTLVTVQPLPQMLARVVDLVFDVVPADRAFLLLRDAEDQAVTARVLRNRDGSIPENATLSRTVINKVMRDRIAMLAADALYDPRLEAAGSIQAMNIRSFMCAPLWNRDVVIGVLYVDNPRSKRFVADDLDVFTALANYAAVAIEQARMSDQLFQETRRRERLQRYHSPGVVNRILHSGSGDDAPFMAQERDVTVMFCDLVSFTTMSQAMEPHQVAQLLNGFFARMADVIFEFEGTLDKFIGDGLLAVFGAPFEQPDHADRAVAAALGMQRALAEMNALPDQVPLSMRIALNSGLALTGDIGSPRRREFTVLGDVVNTASRIQSSVAKPGQILISRATFDRLTGQVNTVPAGHAELRGRVGAVEVFEVRG